MIYIYIPSNEHILSVSHNFSRFFCVLFAFRCFLRVLTARRGLYAKYEDVQFSKKHQEQYLKYTPDAMDEGIRQLFSGRWHQSSGDKAMGVFLGCIVREFRPLAECFVAMEESRSIAFVQVMLALGTAVVSCRTAAVLTIRHWELWTDGH